jgi:hypothetical protein
VVTSPSGLDPDEAAGVTDQFGVALEQVRRDHLMSLALAALTPLADQLIFFGGTALSRAFLPIRVQLLRGCRILRLADGDS